MDQRTCRCCPTCSAPTKRTFAQGHGSVLIGWLREQMAAGRMSATVARKEALTRGAEGGLMLRLETVIKRGGFY